MDVSCKEGNLWLQKYAAVRSHHVLVLQPNSPTIPNSYISFAILCVVLLYLLEIN